MTGYHYCRDHAHKAEEKREAEAEGNMWDEVQNPKMETIQMAQSGFYSTFYSFFVFFLDEEIA
jgi:hypothetical protein